MTRMVHKASQQPILISADWGTTALRIYLLGVAGTILDKRTSADGLTSIGKGEFANVLQSRCSSWLEDRGALPAVLSGMVGSRQGWVEAPYVPCPAGLSELAGRIARLDAPGFSSIHIVPGVDTIDQMGIPDVMRGEECQIMGAQALMGLQDGLYLLPGTHSKWVTVEAARITSFRTFMTGEIFAALKNHTILGRMMTAAAPLDGDAFARGVATAQRSVSPGEWLHRLFSVRTLGLMGRLPDTDAADYLSGLLIGWELASLPATLRQPIIVIASKDLSKRYLAAGRLRGHAMVEAPEDSVCSGHFQIALTAGLLSPASSS